MNFSKEKIKEFLQNKQVLPIVKIFLIIILLFMVLIAFKLSSIPPVIPLYYSLPRSIDQLGTGKSVLLFPFFSIIFSLLNFFIALMLYPKEKLASIMLIISGVVFSFLLFFTFIKIIILIS